MTLCEFCLSELSDPIDSTTYSSRNLSGHIRSIWTWWPLKVTVNGCNISYFSYTDRAKQEEKEEERKKASSVFISSHRNVITEWVHKKYNTKFFHKIQNKVSDNSSLLLVTLSSENQLPGIGLSCLVHLLAHVPPGPGSTWQELLWLGVLPGLLLS